MIDHHLASPPGSYWTHLEYKATFTRQRTHLVDVANDAVLELAVPLGCVVVGREAGGVEEHDKTPILSRSWKLHHNYIVITGL